MRHPTDMRLTAMVKRLHRALNSDDQFETMYAGEMIESIKKMDEESHQEFVKQFNALGGRVTLS